MGEHEDVDHIEDVVVEENRDTCPGPDPTSEWFTKNTWDNMFDPSLVMQAEVLSWMLGEQPIKGMVFATKLVMRHAIPGTHCKRILASKLSIQTQKGLW